MDSETPAPSFTAFQAGRRVAHGPLDAVVEAAARAVRQSDEALVLVFADASGQQVDVDYSGTIDLAIRSAQGGAAAKAAAAEGDVAPRGPGRPRLGVVAREVTLLPRHWQWLNGQPGGASVALRRLVDEARKSHVGRDRVRRGQEVAYRVMSALGGNLPGFEEAIRGLFAHDRERFETYLREWPDDVRAYVTALAEPAFERAS